MTNSMSTREAIQLNNLGAERFSAGELPGSLDAFRHALAFIPGRANQWEDPLRDAVATAPSGLGIAFRSLEDETRKCPEDAPFVYQKPLVFNQMVPETQDGASAFCGVLVFNMALTFDMRSKTANDAHSIKALHLYGSCIDLFSRTSSRVDLTSAIAAACNNRARIYYDQSAFEDSHQELQRLQNYMRLADRSPTKVDILEDDDYQGFLLNLLLLWPPTVALAA